MLAGEHGPSEMLGSIEGPVHALSQADRVARSRVNPNWLAEDGPTIALVVVDDPEDAAYVRACLAQGRMP